MAATAAKEYIAEALSKGSLEVPTSAMLTLLESVEGVRQPPVPFLIEQQTITGTAAKDMVELLFDFQVTVLSVDRWCTVPLLDSGLTVRGVDITGPGQHVFGLVSGEHSLITKTAGVYRVRLTAAGPFSSDKKLGTSFCIPRASQSTLEFTLPTGGLDVKVTPAVTCQVVSTESSTVAHCSLPSTSAVSVQWTAKEVAPVVADDTSSRKKEEMVVTATQHSLFSIGEGVCQSTTIWEFKILHGTKTDFSFRVDARTRVLDAMCDSLKRWEVQAAAPGSSGPQTLRVWLDRAVEDAFAVTVLTEMEMGGTSAEVVLPELACIGTNKEIGFVGVEARTTVEIAELSALGVAKIDVRELSDRVTGAASRPLLHAYKFLAPRFRIKLDVKKHDDVEVLIAVVDQAWAELVVSETRVLTRLAMKVRNTQRQYMRVQLPSAEAAVWSVVVKGAATKPSRDKDGPVLVPLAKSSSGEQESFWVELVYMTQGAALGARGVLDLRLPEIDIPINHLLVTLFLPKEWKWTRFHTGMQRVKCYSVSQPPEACGSHVSTSVSTSVPIASNSVRNAPMRRREQARSDRRAAEKESIVQQQDLFLDDVEELQVQAQAALPMPRGGVYRDPDLESVSMSDEYEPEPVAAPVPQARGVVPVTVELPRAGEQVRFERLLVMGSPPGVRATYRRPCGCC